MLLAVLHFITDRTRAAEFVHELMAALPPGSYLLASHATQDFETPEAIATYRTMLDQGRSDVWPATRADMAAVFDGFTLIEPGIVPAGECRPASGGRPRAPRFPTRSRSASMPGWPARTDRTIRGPDLHRRS